MTQASLTLEFSCSELLGSFTVQRLSGYEAISECFDFEVEFARSDEEVDVDACLKPGTSAAITFKQHGEVVRVMHGCLLEFGTRLPPLDDDDGPHSRWVVRFAPRLWSTKFQIRTEVYSGSVQEILTALLRRAGLYENLDFEFRLADAYPSREFVLQYHESDYAFMTRLLEHWGIAFSFEHDTRERVIFTDHNSAMLDIACWKRPDGERAEDAELENPSADPQQVTSLPFRRFSGGEADARSSVASHDLRTKRVPKSFATHDYNYRLPHIELTAEHPVLPQGDGRVVEHGLHSKLPEETAHIARIRAELLGSTRVIHHGTSGNPLLRSGGSFTLHPDPDGNETRLLVHRVEHRLGETYRVRFHAQPLETPYRPALLTPKPRIAGYLGGTVHGSDPTTPNLDAEGRYRVFLDCDTGEAEHTRIARPMRMLQMHAGANYGMHFPLKPGTEVAIGFMNGDPDRPFIAGALPNPMTPSPVRGERGNVRRNVIQSMNGVQIELDDGSIRRRSSAS